VGTGEDDEGGLTMAEDGHDPLDTAFSTSAEVHAFVHGFYAGMKRPHRFPSPPDDGESARESHYWKGGVIASKAVLVAAVVVTTYTQIGGL